MQGSKLQKPIKFSQEIIVDNSPCKRSGYIPSYDLSYFFRASYQDDLFN